MRIVIAESQETMRRAIVSCLEERRFHVIQVAGRRDLEIALHQPAELLILDEGMVEGPLPAFLDRLRATAPALSIIVMSYRDSVNDSIEALQHGAVEYLVKPFPVELLETAVEKALGMEASATPPSGGSDVRYLSIESLPSVQKNPQMKKAVGLLTSVADSDITVLIGGESGVGKEVFAQTIHQRSRRRLHRFVDINCASVPASLLESELFGCERGAFTGAVSTRLGKFELAQKGTIFLDEVSEMDVALQAKLLRVIQEKSLYRIGGDRKVQLDVRIVATTNRDLREWVRKGNFREDLFYRLNVISVYVPALRERREDIPVLAQFILDRFNRENRKNLQFSIEAIEQLYRYDWPGNIRELENILFLTAFLTPSRKITRIHFDEGNPHVEDAAASPAGGTTTASVPALSGTIEAMEREMIRQALLTHTGNRTHAANALGISVRTLRNKLRLYPDLDPLAKPEIASDRAPMN